MYPALCFNSILQFLHLGMGLFVISIFCLESRPFFFFEGERYGENRRIRLASRQDCYIFKLALIFPFGSSLSPGYLVPLYTLSLPLSFKIGLGGISGK